MPANASIPLPDCTAVKTSIAPIANGANSVSMGPSAPVLMSGGFPILCGGSSPGVPAQTSDNANSHMPANASIPMPDGTEYVDEDFEYDVKSASDVPEEKPVEASVRPSSKPKGP